MDLENDNSDSDSDSGIKCGKNNNDELENLTDKARANSYLKSQRGYTKHSTINSHSGVYGWTLRILMREYY